MASLGHLAVGMAAARIYGAQRPGRRASLAAILFWSAISFLPDADVVGFGLGVRYEDEWGHRGATHSLLFSVAIGAAIGIAAPLLGRSRCRTGLIASLVLVSHALLDTLTNGGLGCALLWPFDSSRYFAPWTPIPVSPIGLSFLSPYGLFVAMTELLLFAPLIWVALRSRNPAPAWSATRRRLVPALSIAVWAVGLWLFFSSDPVREWVVRRVLGDNTEFTPGFSEDRLDAVERGASASDVRSHLGSPFHEFLIYEDGPDTCVVVRINGEVVGMAQPADPCARRGVRAGHTRAAVYHALGAPLETCWVYSRPPNRGYFRARGVCFTGDRVSMILRRWMRE